MYNAGLFLDLAAYSIITEGNAAQHYPTYAYNHPLFTEKMHIYSDSKISDFLASVSDDARVGFLNDWDEKRDHGEKIYISYDSTNKNCQAGDMIKSQEYEAIQPEMDVIRAIVAARTSQNLTQKELAERTGINQADISKLENGTRNPSVNLLKRLADGMGMALKIEFVPKQKA